MSRSVRRRLVVAGVALVAVMAGAGLWLSTRTDGATPAAPAASASATASATPLVPAGTPEAVTSPPPASVATDPPRPVAGGTVDPVVTYAGWEQATASVEVNGYVSGVVEAGGTCRLTLTNGSAEAVAQTAAEPEVSTTTCGLLQVAGGALTAGTWQAVLSYESATSTGRSAPVDVEVPAR
jgi:hypothetical protein